MLEIKNLHVEVDNKEILHGIDLDVETGKIHVLMGPNGSGKSTLSNSIAGHPKYSVTKGSVIVDDMDVSHSSPDERAKQGIFLSMQYTPNIAGVTVGNFLRVAHNSLTGEKVNPLKYHKQLIETANILSIPESFLSRSLGEGFSGGEKKRLEMLQLLVLNPHYAILDETDSGLDIDALSIVMDAIKQFVAKQKGVLLITHYPAVLEHIDPDMISVMKDGKIVMTGGKELVEKIKQEGFVNL